jgi:cation transport ATPase
MKPRTTYFGFEITLEVLIAAMSIAAIALHLVLRASLSTQAAVRGINLPALPLLAALAVGGIPLVWGLARRAMQLEFSSDLLAGISIVTAVLLGEYLAGTFVVLMLAGGQALEEYAVRHASSALRALARRMPSHAHRKIDGTLSDVPLNEVVVGDVIVILPHETCPVDGVVVEGRSTMNEAYLTGEPYLLPKAVGAAVLSGAINGEGALTVRAEKKAVDSRYSKIMQVMHESEQHRPRMRRLGDQIGAWFTPLAVAIAVVAWIASQDPVRFLSVLVVATPCPLLIGIPVVIISSVSLAARRGIIIKDPAVLETIDTCHTAIFDKTGTLTYGEPTLTEIELADGFTRNDLLMAVASLERYSRHPLASAVVDAAARDGLALVEATEVRERPGQGLRGVVSGRMVEVTSRKKVAARSAEKAQSIPPLQGGWNVLFWSMTVTPDCFAFAMSRESKASRSLAICSPATALTAFCSFQEIGSRKCSFLPRKSESRRFTPIKAPNKKWRWFGRRWPAQTRYSWVTASTTHQRSQPLQWVSRLAKAAT